MARKTAKSKKTETHSFALVSIKSTAGRKCSVCTHEKVREINAEIREGTSFRDISRHFGMSKDSVQRHTENCLKLEIQALIEQNRIENAVDHYEAIRKQLRFAEELQQAAREWLTDPETGKISFMPRAHELDIIYLDGADLDMFGRPTRKTAKLQDIIDLIQNIAPEVRVIGNKYKISDTRTYANETIRMVDLILDKFARVDGHYMKEKENPDDVMAKVIRAFNMWLDDNPHAIAREKAVWVTRFATGANIEPKELAKKVGVNLEIVQEVEGIQ